MKTALLRRLFPWLLPTLLVAVAGILIWRNHVPGTWLTGWDTLHPEFDLSLAFQRMWHGVWRTDQGLGALAAHSHMSELPRLLVLSLLSVVFPAHLLRYAFIGLCFLVGPVGVFFLTRELLPRKSSLIAQLGAFLAGLLYMGNLGTVQHFFVVFEMFAVAYAAIPWLWYLGLRFLKTGTRHTLVGLGIVGFLSSAMAYASTLWFASMAGFCLFLAGYALVKRSKKSWRRIVIAGLVLLAVNAYWLLPNLYYFASSGGQGPAESKISQLFSPESFLHNKAYGSIADTLLLRNFLFNWQIYDFESQQFVMLLETWQQHSQQFAAVGFLLMSITLFGLVIGFAQRTRWRLALALPFVLAGVVLAIDTPVIGQVFEWLRATFPFLKEALRTPFTKFSLIALLVYSVAFAAGWQALAYWIKQRFGIAATAGLWIVLAGSIALWSLPMWQGELISKRIQLEIPEAYFELFSFMKQQPAQARVALLPMSGPFGWEYLDWGYQGAGFLWFGMPQSVLVRDFDRWSPYNETFYLQLQAQLTAGDATGVRRVLEQYRVQYLLVDQHLTKAGQPLTQEELTALEEVLLASGAHPIWDYDQLTVYQTTAEEPTALFVPADFIPVQIDSVKTKVDPAFHAVGTYVEATPAALQYPFADLFRENLEGVIFQEDFFTLSREIIPSSGILVPPFEVGNSLTVPATLQYEERQLLVEFESSAVLESGETALRYQLPSLTLPVPFDSPEITVSLNDRIATLKRGQTLSEFVVSAQVGESLELQVFDPAQARTIPLETAFAEAPVTPCWDWPGRSADVHVQTTVTTKSVAVTNGAACVSLPLTQLVTQASLATVTVPSQSSTSTTPEFCVSRADDTEQTCLHSPVGDLTQSQMTWTDVVRHFQVEPDESYWLDLIAGPVTAVDKPESVDYQTPRLLISPLIAQAAWESSVWDAWTQPQSFPSTDNHPLTVRLSTVPFEETVEVANLTTLENCDPFGRGTARIESFSFWSHDQGVGCAHLRLAGITPHQEGLLLVRSRHTAGRPLKMYLVNDRTGKTELETLLAEGEQTQSFSLLAQPGTNESYILSFENRSFGAELSRNELLSIQTAPVPLTWLQNLKVESGSNSDSQSIANQLRVVRTQSYGPTYHLVEVSGEGLIVLNQGFHSGWIGLLDFTILPHTQVNGWANGWFVPREGVVILVYWPQYLEWLGFFLSIGGLGWLAASLARQALKTDL